MRIIPIKSIALGLVALVTFWAMAKCSSKLVSSETPAQTLASTIKALEANDLETAARILDLKADSVPWKHWVLLYQGLVLERQQKPVDAFKLYEQVDPNSAASLDARLGMLRLKSQNPAHDYGKIIATLETELSLASREDLRPELLLLQATEAEKDSLQLALSIYSLLREKYPFSAEAKQAKESYYRIYSSSTVSIGEISVAEHLAEAKRLLSEGDLTHALERTHNAKAMVAERSNAYLEAILLEAEILKKQQRNLESERMLSIVANEGGLGMADIALLTLGKNYWDANEDTKALTVLQNLIRRFPSSPVADDARYLEGRVYEDMGKSGEARESFQSLSTASLSPLKKIQALRRMAWSYMSQKNYSFAAQYFNKARLQADSAISKPTTIKAEDEVLPESVPSEKLSDLIYELEHSLYWEGFAISKLTTGTNATNEPWQKLLSLNPYGYYGQLVAAVVTPGSIVTLPKRDASCDLPIDNLIQTTLSNFSTPELKPLAQHEIDWAYKIEESPKAPFEIKIDSNETIKHLATKIELSSIYGQIEQAIGLGQRVLAQTYKSQSTLTCLNNIRPFIYPRPFGNEAQQAAQEANVDLSLVYAVARTESHFNPLARSSSNALGLMQLLPSTAESLGSKSETELFSPATNLRLGAKYLSELLKQYNNNKTYAIAAYNAGPTNVSKWQARFQNLDDAQFTEMIPFNETRDYVKKVLSAEMLYREAKAKPE